MLHTRWLAGMVLVGMLGTVSWLAAAPPNPLGSVVQGSSTGFRTWAQGATAVSVEVTGHAAVPMRAEGHDVWSADVGGVGPGDTYDYRVSRGGTTVAEVDARASALEHGQSVVVEGWPRPRRFTASPANRLVIYELHIGSFAPDSSGHYTFAGAEGRLDYLQHLGINAVELMPVNENVERADNSPVEYNWGYDGLHLDAVKQAYGTSQQLAHLVQACHAHGMAVIVDVVYNHLSRGNVLDASYFSSVLTPWGPRPDYRVPQVDDYILNDALAWLQNYGMDGLRVDSVINIRHFPAGPDDADGQALLKRLNTERTAGTLTIAEDLWNDPQVVRADGLGFDAQWDDRLWYALRDVLVPAQDADRHLGPLAAVLRSDGRPYTHVIYSENHDKVGHPQRNERRFPTLISPDDPDSLVAIQRSSLAAAVVLTAPGIPMLFQGQETSDPRTFDFHQRTPVDWSRLQSHAGMLAMYRDLLAIRRNLAGLAGDYSNPYHVDDNNHTLAWQRSAGAHDDVVVVANFSAAPLSLRIGLPHSGLWRVRFDSSSSNYDARLTGPGSQALGADEQPADGLPCSGTISTAPYSLVVLSQD